VAAAAFQAAHARTTPLTLIAFILALLAIASPLSAQVSAAISGRVLDPSGAGIGGAGITIRSAETGATRYATTDETGSYRVDSLPLGAIEVHAEKDGFKAVTRTGISLVVGQDAPVNLHLEVGDRIDHIDIVEGIPTVRPGQKVATTAGAIRLTPGRD